MPAEIKKSKCQAKELLQRVCEKITSLSFERYS